MGFEVANFIQELGKAKLLDIFDQTFMMKFRGYAQRSRIIACGMFQIYERTVE